MNLVDVRFSCPVLCIDNFLGDDEAAKVLRECIDLRKVYVRGKVFDGPTTTKRDPEYRTNDVVALTHVFRDDQDRSDILTLMKQTLWSEQYRPLWHDGYSIFDIINYSTWHEAVVSRYGNGHFYKKHRDTRWDHVTYRLVTLIYYVNKEPQEFTGGTLVLWDDDRSARIEPKHNRAVVFPSFVYHEVEPVAGAGDGWADARFSLNYWIGFR